MNNLNQDNFPKNLKHYRLKNNLTQKQLGSLLGVSESIICRWEQGNRFPRFNMLNRLAEVLHTNTFSFFF